MRSDLLPDAEQELNRTGAAVKIASHHMALTKNWLPKTALPPVLDD
jgi:hypothetical protein